MRSGTRDPCAFPEPVVQHVQMHVQAFRHSELPLIPPAMHEGQPPCAHAQVLETSEALDNFTRVLFGQPKDDVIGPEEFRKFRVASAELLEEEAPTDAEVTV